MSIREDSLEYIKNNSKKLINTYIGDHTQYQSGNPDCFFMAGSPGAGKTEVTKSFLNSKSHFQFSKRKYIRIDADEIRSFLPQYNKRNSSEVQNAASKGVYILFDYATHNNCNFILDGTFSSTKVSQDNIKRCINKNYKVNILFVYQDPVVAWSFTKKREALEGRPIPKEGFISAYFNSRKNVNQIKKTYKSKIDLYLIEKNIDNKIKKFKINAPSVDSYIKERYDEKSLRHMLK